MFCLELKQYQNVSFNTKGRTDMGMIIKDTGTDSTFELAPSGAFAARCYRIIDLGTQTFQVKGETKESHQILMAWELSKKMADGQPFVISEKYTSSLHEKAKLRSVLESWRGRKFSEVERNGFDIEQVLGKVCFLNIVHSKKGDKTYANVASVMPVPEGLPSPAAVNEQLFFNIEEWNDKVFAKIPKYYQGMIKRSPEYGSHDAGESYAQEAQQAQQAAWEEDEMPF